LGVLKAMQKKNFEQLPKYGKYLLEKLILLKDTYPVIKEIRA